jgi:endonuclease/exonuclease/phosphatase (EEP) superfamily protein YafD
MLLASVYKSPLRGWQDADITELLNLRTKSILSGDLNAKHPVWNSKVSNPSGLKFLDFFVNSKFKFSAPQRPTHFVPNRRGDVLDLVFRKVVWLSEVRMLIIMDSDHLSIMFCIMDYIKDREMLDPVEKFTDWERFQSLASVLVSPRMEINLCVEADKAACDFTASIASAYRLSTKTTTISDNNRGSSSLERLRKHKQRLRKLCQETRDPAC